MFDLKVHHHDPKTGRLVSSKDYKLMISSEGRFFEQPIGSGLLYTEDGKLAKDLNKEKAEAQAKADAAALEAQARVSEEPAKVEAPAKKKA